MLHIHWNPFFIKSQKGKNLRVELKGYNESREKSHALLQAIARRPKDNKKAVSVVEAYDAMLTACGKLVFESIGDGNGAEAARLINQGFVATATELGYFIELTGDEFEVMNLAS